MSYGKRFTDFLFKSGGKGAAAYVPHQVMRCGYCPDYDGDTCVRCDPTGALGDYVAHVIQHHWDELVRIRTYAEEFATNVAAHPSTQDAVHDDTSNPELMRESTDHDGNHEPA